MMTKKEIENELVKWGAGLVNPDELGRYSGAPGGFITARTTEDMVCEDLLDSSVGLRAGQNLRLNFQYFLVRTHEELRDCLDFYLGGATQIWGFAFDSVVALAAGRVKWNSETLEDLLDTAAQDGFLQKLQEKVSYWITECSASKDLIRKMLEDWILNLLRGRTTTQLKQSSGRLTAAIDGLNWFIDTYGHNSELSARIWAFELRELLRIRELILEGEDAEVRERIEAACSALPSPDKVQEWELKAAALMSQRSSDPLTATDEPSPNQTQEWLQEMGALMSQRLLVPFDISKAPSPVPESESADTAREELAWKEAAEGLAWEESDELAQTRQDELLEECVLRIEHEILVAMEKLGCKTREEFLIKLLVKTGLRP